MSLRNLSGKSGLGRDRFEEADLFSNDRIVRVCYVERKGLHVA
jgi:hypothetical protein